MREFSYIITDENGVHARPAGLLVKLASHFEGEATAQKGEKTANLKRIMSVMQLGVKCGDEVTFRIEGGDEDKDAETLIKFLKENL